MIGPDGKISPATADAVARAIRAGVTVAPCTGRGWRESVQLLQAIDGLELGVFNTGAIIARIGNGEHVDLAIIEPNLAMQLVEALADEPEAVLVYQEANLAGHDYLVTGRGELTPSIRWWFSQVNLQVHVQRQVTEDDLHHTLRVGMAAQASRVAELEQRIHEQFGDQVLCHSFQAVKQDDERDADLCVLEIFAAGVDKWRGIRWIADQQGIASEQVAAIGDEINDLSMLQNAGLGIAMGNAADIAKQTADVQTRTHGEEGVAYAIDQMLAGAW